MSNNRKRTKGRKIQAIKVPLTIIEWTKEMPPRPKIVRNPHNNAGGTIQVRHLV